MGVSPSKSCASADTSLSLSMASSGVCAASDARRASRADGLSSSPINDRRRALGGRRPEPRPEPGGSDGNDRASATLRRPPSPPPRCSQESLEAAADARRASACACTRASSEVPDSSKFVRRVGGADGLLVAGSSEAAPESSESARGSPSRFATDEATATAASAATVPPGASELERLRLPRLPGVARPAEDDGRRLEMGRRAERVRRRAEAGTPERASPWSSSGEVKSRSRHRSHTHLADPGVAPLGEIHSPRCPSSQRSHTHLSDRGG